MRPKAEALGYLEARTTSNAKTTASAEADPCGMTARKASTTATASATTTTGVLRFVQDDEIGGAVILRLWVRW
jgi:hypothetical protein